MYATATIGNEVECQERSANLGLMILGALLVFGALIVSGTWFWRHYQMDAKINISNVRIGGDIRYLNPAEVKQVVYSQLDKGLLKIDVGALRNRLQLVPWIQNARVWRRWPDTLEIEIAERVPMARWGAFSVISKQGVVFTPDNLQVLKGFVSLSGPDARASLVGETYRKFSEMLGSENLHVKRLELTDRLTWILELKNGINIYLGSKNYAKQLAKLIKFYPAMKVSLEKVPSRIDLRYTNGFSVVWSDHTWELQKNKRVTVSASNFDGRIAGRGSAQENLVEGGSNDQKIR